MACLQTQPKNNIRGTREIFMTLQTNRKRLQIVKCRFEQDVRKFVGFRLRQTIFRGMTDLISYHAQEFYVLPPNS